MFPIMPYVGERTRSPLSDATNSPLHSPHPSRSPSPVYHTAKTGKLRQHCLRPSLRNVYPELDSSEDVPSVHSSIYEAGRFPSAELLGSLRGHLKNNDQIVSTVTDHHSRGDASETATTNNDIAAQNAHAIDSVQVLSPTNTASQSHVCGSIEDDQQNPLDLVFSEPNSVTTVRPKAASSPQETLDIVSDRPKVVLGFKLRVEETLSNRAADTHPGTLPIRIPSKVPSVTFTEQAQSISPKRSASFDDLAHLNGTATLPPSTNVQKSPCRALSIIASPKEPPFIPPTRMPTPEGIPSWRTFQARHFGLGPPAPVPKASKIKSLPRRLFARRTVNTSPHIAPNPGKSIISILHSKQKRRERKSKRERDHGGGRGRARDRADEPFANLTRADDRPRVPAAPRFRAPRSGHGDNGTIDEHPFHFAPVAKLPKEISTKKKGTKAMIKGRLQNNNNNNNNDANNAGTTGSRRVHFTPSILGRDDEEEDRSVHDGGAFLMSGALPPPSSSVPETPPPCAHSHLRNRILNADDDSTPRSINDVSEQRLLAFPTFRREKLKGKWCWRCMLGKVWSWIRWICCGVEDDGEDVENARLVEEGRARMH